MKKILLFFVFALIIVNLNGQSKIPRLFKLDWGLSFSSVADKISNKDVGLTPMKHYPIYKGRSEIDDLKLSSFIKYQSDGAPFFDIPSSVIFTFFNPDGSKNRLQLSKIEVYLARKDSNKISIDVKSTYRNLISIFCENYGVSLKLEDEKAIFSNYNYQVSINGIFVNFTANIETISFAEKEAIFFSYESSEYQRLILKKEIELTKEKDDVDKKDDDKSDINVKRNL
ncbi:MAG TPA: hypothetical protein PK771_12560 [Spirochaetota bacterium]|nr:hypothetical protein [Spirochaetota bacterium]